MSDVKLVIDGAAMARLLRSPTGPVGRHLIERGEIVKQAARAKAPRLSGCLQDSIVKRVEEDVKTGFAIRVIANTAPCSPDRTSYALWVHEGTRPHNIPGAFGLPAPFGIGGRFDNFFHPGNRANPFLTDALPLAVA